MSNKREFGFKLKIGGDISDILSSLKALQGAFDKVEMPDSLTKALTKDIANAIQKVGEFEKKSEAAINSLSDSKEITNAWKSVQKELNALEVKLEGIDSSKLFPKEVTDNLNKATSAAEKYVKALEGSKSSEQFQRKLGELNRIAEQERANEALRKKAHQSEVQAEAIYFQRKAQWTEQINQQYEEQQAAITQSNQRLEEQKNIVKQLVDEQAKLQAEGYLSKQNQPYTKKNEAAKQLTQAEAEVTLTGRSVSAAKGQVTRYENKNSEKNLKNDQEYLKLKQKLTEAENKHKTALEKVQELKSKTGDTKKLNRANEIGAEIAKAKEYQRALEGEATAAKNAATDLGEQKRALDQSKEAYEAAAAEAAGYQIQLDKLSAESEELNEDLKKIQTDAAEKEWQDLVQIVKEFIGIDLSESAHDMEAFTNAIDQYKQGKIDKLPDILKEILANAKPIPEAVDKIGDELREMGDDVKSATDAANEMDNLKRQVMDFFSITNSIQLFKRAVTSALNTVKELDATMTEAAVVTEFDVGDMWEKLPQYSKEAQNLGVSINGMYQATTLYYQQGLKNQEAMELGIETMKMGKIAAMDSTEATKAMTAALRGFNMELNETSATRVNDVYSQLAAVTAADTNQIATAMEKTASIAASANMEFETTAAFLAQIIETTQEAPETAGTALKTIIARFAEVKSLRDQGLTSGEDEEGEIIDVNKIQTALRSVGISMEGFFNGTEGLDSILLKLSEKWGTLDFETQRYIATMAAGSRQQSRFIAMMSDYGRTTELVGEAQNSAGASQDQFNKTLDSMDTKLQKLENAWKQFLMGLANNEVLKAGVDGLTKILETVNKITDGISGGNGLIKSVVSLAGVLATLKGGRALLGGTAVGGAMSGLVGRITGGKSGEVSNKSTIFSVPEGFGPNETKGVGKAKRAELRAKAKQRLKQTFKVQKTEEVVKYDKKAMQKRIGQSYNSVTPEQQKGLVELGKQLKNNEISAEGAAEKMKILGIETSDLNTITQKASLDFNAMGQAANTAGMAMMAAGAATSLLASAFESWGMKEEAEAMQSLSGVLMTLGPILMGIGSFLPTLTGLTAAQAAATWAALWPILLVVAALGALVAVIVLVAKHQHDISLEGRMQAAAEATERAKEAAESAKQSYDNLLGTKSDYDELQNKLDTLTEGTIEWKKALMESNAQVLELLKTYPQLAQYISKGMYGELEISDIGWEKITELAFQGMVNANSSLIASQISESNLNIENARSQARDKIEEIGIDGMVFEKLLRAYQDEGAALFTINADGSANSELKKIVPSIDDVTNGIYELQEVIEEYEKATLQHETELEAQSETLVSMQVSDETSNYKHADAIISAVSKQYTKNKDNEEQELLNDMSVLKNHSVRDNAKFKEIAEKYKISESRFTGDNVHDLEVLYATMTGIDVNDISGQIKGNETALSEEIAKMYIGNQAGDRADQIYKSMSLLDEEKQGIYASLISGDYSKITGENINRIGNVDLETMAQDLGFEDKEDENGTIITATEQMAEAFGYESTVDKDGNVITAFENMSAALSDSREKAMQELGDIVSKVGDYGIDFSKGYVKKMTLEQQKKYANMLMQASQQGTSDILQKGFEAIFESVTEDQKTKISSFMETADWTQEGEGERFLEFLKDMNVNIEKVIPNIKDFSNAIKQINASYRTFTLSDTINKIQASVNEAEQIKGQNELTTEQYEKYLKDGLINADDWSFNGKGWENTVDGMDKLVDALIENTKAIYETDKQEAKKQLKEYQDKTNQLNSSDLMVIRNWVTDQEFLARKSDWDAGRYNGTYEQVNNVSVSQYVVNNQVDEYWWKQFFPDQKAYDNYRLLGQDKAAQTEQYLKGMEKIDPSLFGPTINGNTSKWENPYDKRYNTYEKINALLRQRNKLERQYQKLLDKSSVSGADIVKNTKEQLKNLEDQKKQQEYLQGKKAGDIQSLISKNSKYKKYVTGFDEKTGKISIDWSAINKIKNTNTGEAVEEYISKLEELRDQWVETQDALDTIEDEVKEIREQGKDEYFDLETRLKDALIQSRQDEIDKLSNINDSINEANSNILNAMQQQIDEYRQNRENEKTEKELADKQRRLAYLQQDTSGANAQEIMKLQEEIEQGQEDYTDTLIDQKISDLQKQNDEAAKQREKQIGFLQAQLEQYEESGRIWDDVYKLMETGITSNGTVIQTSELVNKLKETEGFKGMSKLNQDNWMSDLAVTVAQAFGYVHGNIRAKEKQTVTFTTSDNKTLTGTADKNGNIKVNGKTYTGVHQTKDGEWVTDENTKKTTSTTTTSTTSKGSGNISSLPGSVNLTASQIKKLQKGLNELLKDGKLSDFDKLSVDGEYGPKTKEAVKILQKKIKVSADGRWGPSTRAAFLASSLKAYKTGGLADFTGPAWLDGTKSKPEYILNAEQTKAFFQLVDVLGSLRGDSSNSSENNGDTTYDIDINVESIGSDYDVERMAEKVKGLIVSDSRYRNNNVLG